MCVYYYYLYDYQAMLVYSLVLRLQLCFATKPDALQLTMTKHIQSTSYKNYEQHCYLVSIIALFSDHNNYHLPAFLVTEQCQCAYQIAVLFAILIRGDLNAFSHCKW
jgi:hypothetical protein